MLVIRLSINISRFRIDQAPIKLTSKKKNSANFTSNCILIFLGIKNDYQSFLLDYQSIKKKEVQSSSWPANFTEVS